MGGKKKVIGQTNPFEFSPCEFNEFIYACREPFVDVVRGKFEEVEGNKFAGGQMLLQTLDHFIAESASQYAFAEKLFSVGASTEGNFRPIHIMALGAPGMFVRPTDDEWSEYESNNPSWTRKSLKAYMKASAGANSMPQATNQGFFVARYTEEAQGDGGSSSSTDSDVNSNCNSGYEPQREGSAVSEYGLANRYREDLLLFTHNKSDCKRFKEEHEDNVSPDSKMLAGAAECKDDQNCSVDGLFQAAGCARAGVIRNVENGHGRPVYLLCVGMTKWYYGVLVIHGVVQVSKNKAGKNLIRGVDFEDYLATCKTTKTGCVLSHQDLDSKLGIGLRKLQKNCSDNDCTFPVQKYVVGKLYVPRVNSWLELPSSLKPRKLNRPDARLFIEGIMRLIIGDTVVQWTPEKVTTAKLIRLAMISDAARKGGAQVEIAMKTNKKFSRFIEDSAAQEGLSSEFEEFVQDLRARGGVVPPEKLKLEAAKILQQLDAVRELCIARITGGLELSQSGGAAGTSEVKMELQGPPRVKQEVIGTSGTSATVAEVSVEPPPSKKRKEREVKTEVRRSTRTSASKSYK